MALTGPAPFIALGHRHPYSLPGRATIAEALSRRIVADDSTTPVVATLQNGLRMSVPRSREGASLLFSGCLMGEEERSVTALFQRLLRPGDVFFDVGSHLGFYSTLAAGLTTPDGRIHTFEAQEWLIPHLNESVAINGLQERVRVNNVAVVAVDGGSVRIYPARDDDNTGSASLQDHDWVDTSTAHQVSGIALDAYVIRNGIDRIDGMKIDVEGAEIGVIEGMTTILATMPPRLMMIELMLNADGMDRDARDGAQAVCETLSDAGYTVHHINMDGTLGNRFDLQSTTGVTIGNFGFAHKTLRADRPDMFKAE